MNKLTCNSINEFLQSRVLTDEIYQKIVSAAKYYIGTPDGKYFKPEYFHENVVMAKKAYVTLNTIMGYETAEYDRFCEGKQQIPELITPLGVRKMINLFTLLYCFSVANKKSLPSTTLKMCRQSEISEGLSIIKPLTSTTKLSIEEIMALGYGDKKNLAICKYTFHEGAVFFDFEELGENYLKPEEREVLLFPGTKLVAHYYGCSDKYFGSDKKPALMYNVEVFPPHFDINGDSQENLENIVFDETALSEIQDFYSILNIAELFPRMPECYLEWKKAFQQLVFRELKKVLY